MVRSDEQSKLSPSKGQWRWRLYYIFLAIALLYILLTGLIASLTKNTPASKLVEEEGWISSSHFWLDRQLCRWIGCCGTFHMLNRAGWVWPETEPRQPVRDFSHFWHTGSKDHEKWSEAERQKRTIPQYVFDHAPYVHLFSAEPFWASDIAEHLVHVEPYLNHSAIDELHGTRDLGNMDELNNLTLGYGGQHTYLRSSDNIEALPEWLVSAYNIPSADTSQDLLRQGKNARCGGADGTSCASGQCCSVFGWCGTGDDHCGDTCDPTRGNCYGPHQPGRFQPHTDLKKRSLSQSGESTAPAFLIVVPKEDHIVDAFWFFFYSYNRGKKVLNIQFGDHVGDWEHTMIRFQHGKPQTAFLSAHSWGQSVDFDALEKYALQGGTILSSLRNETTAVFRRPVVFSAEGSHAMYPTPDYHDYVAPFGILHDDTDRGPLWDPTLNVKSFTFDPVNDVVRSSTLNPDAPTGWFDYAGHWGDKYNLLSDPRQYRFAGEYHYVNGPQGPKFKNLGRKRPCERDNKICKIRTSITRDNGAGTIHVLRAGGEDAEDGD